MVKQTDKESRFPDAEAVHHSPVAGSWYPGRPDELRKLLKGFFDAVPAVPEFGNTIAVISPHAGFVYSGRTAAHAIAALAARRMEIQRLLILAPSHTSGFNGVSISAYSVYRTPLGDAAVDLAAVARLRECPLVQNISHAHQHEHADDIQIPLLQFAFEDRMPRIVPVVVGRLRDADYPVLARVFAEVLGPDAAVLVSSDFTHYGPNYDFLPFPPGRDTADNLTELNQRARKAVLSLRRAEFEEYLAQTGDTICGARPIGLLLEMLPAETRGQTLCFDTSGALTGDFTNSVSYAALAFYHAAGWPASAWHTEAQDSAESERLTPEEQKQLLALARQTMVAAAEARDLPTLKHLDHFVRLRREQSAFVTLKNNGELRGCIGSIFPTETLAESVRRHAVSASQHDYRFTPVAAREIPDLQIEISALSPPREIASWREIEIGRDGVILQMRGASAVFLPQVAPEQGWTVEEMLAHLSMKAGLPHDAWKSPSAKFLTFQAQVFHE